MRAAIFRQHGGPEVLAIDEVPDPKPGPDQVLINVRAAALNHLDLWTRRGLPGLELEFPHIGGSDLAGTVIGLGERVDNVEVGARVLVNPSLWCGDCEWCRKGEESLCSRFRIIGEHISGGLAEYIAVPARNVLAVPDDLSFEQAAAVPLVYQTAWRGLIGRGRLRPGETVLITGGSGGVDLVFDSVGETLWPDILRALARDGRLVTYGATTGPRGQVDIRLAFWKQLQVIGSTMSSRSEFEEVMRLVFQGKLEPVIDVVWPIDNVRKAHERLEGGAQFGKIVLTPTA